MGIIQGLEACWFCGSNMISMREKKTDGMSFVRCVGCGAQGPEVGNDSQAGLAWSRPVRLAKVVIELEELLVECQEQLSQAGDRVGTLERVRDELVEERDMLDERVRESKNTARHQSEALVSAIIMGGLIKESNVGGAGRLDMSHIESQAVEVARRLMDKAMARRTSTGQPGGSEGQLCNECGANLSGDSTVHIEEGLSAPVIQAAQCPACKTEAFEEGYIKGLREGYGRGLHGDPLFSLDAWIKSVEDDGIPEMYDHEEAAELCRTPLKHIPMIEPKPHKPSTWEHKVGYSEVKGDDES